jgi:hypothetical protein
MFRIISETVFIQTMQDLLVVRMVKRLAQLKLNVKVKAKLYRPKQALRAPEG